MSKDINELVDYLYKITVHSGTARAEDKMTRTIKGKEALRELCNAEDVRSDTLKAHNLHEVDGRAFDAMNHYHTMLEDACFKEGLLVGLKTVDLC